MTDTLLFKISLIIYFVSALGYAASILIKRVAAAKASTLLFLTAFCFHSLYFLVRVIGKDHLFVNLYDALSLLAWFMAGVYLTLQLKTKTRVLGSFVAPLVFLFMVSASIGLREQVQIPAALKGWLVTTHVMLSVAGEAFFVLACCAGAMYLIQEGMIKHRRMTRLTKLFPSLHDLDRINHFCISCGFPLMTMGIIAGSVWARAVWGSHWQWDPKQVWTLTVWGGYAMLLHQRLAIGWKGHKAALFSIIAFLVVFAFLVAENMFLVTVHRFG